MYASTTYAGAIKNALTQPSSNVQHTDWKTPTNKRKQESPESRPRAKQTKVSTWLSGVPRTSIKTTNNFELLADSNDVEETEGTTNKETVRVKKPPPIFVAGVENITNLTNELKTSIPNCYVLKTLNNDEVKIQTSNEDAYRKVIDIGHK